MSIEIRPYPIIDELEDVQSNTQSIVNRIEGDILPAIHRNNAKIHDATVSLEHLEDRLNHEVEAISYEQLCNYKRQKKLIIASIIYALLSTSAIIYLFLR